MLNAQCSMVNAQTTVITGRNDVIITGDFEVKLGAELEVNMSNHTSWDYYKFPF